MTHDAARPRPAARLKIVGIAIDDLALRRSVSQVLDRDARYRVSSFHPTDVLAGTWPHRPYAAVVTTPRAFRARGDGGGGYPVVLVVHEGDLLGERTSLAASDAFVLTERLAALLPSIIILSAHRLSVMPVERAGRPLEVDPRLLMLPRLPARDRAVLAELANGSDNGTIAARLAISESMAKVCVRRVIDLLGFRNRTDAGVFAAMLGLDGAGQPHTTFAGGVAKRG